MLATRSRHAHHHSEQQISGIVDARVDERFSFHVIKNLLVRQYSRASLVNYRPSAASLFFLIELIALNDMARTIGSAAVVCRGQRLLHS